MYQTVCSTCNIAKSRQLNVSLTFQSTIPTAIEQYETLVGLFKKANFLTLVRASIVSGNRTQNIVIDSYLVLFEFWSAAY